MLIDPSDDGSFFICNNLGGGLLMDNQEIRIGGGRTEAFLVADKSLGNSSPPFIEWLHAEGFKFCGYHGNYGCTWVHVNITRKQYAYL